MVLCSTPSPAEINSPLVLSQASSLRRCVLIITGTVLRKTINIKTEADLSAVKKRNQ